MNVQDITVDLSKKNVKPECIVLRQGDKNGTTLRVKVLDGGSDASSLNEYSVNFSMRCPDKEHYYEVSGTLSGNIATVLINEEYAAAYPGVTDLAYISIVDGENKTVSTNNVRVEVLPSAEDGIDPSHAWSSDIEEAVEAANNAATAANTAADAANEAAAYANEAAAYANEAAAYANEAAAYASSYTDTHLTHLIAGAADSLLGKSESWQAMQHVSGQDGLAVVESLRGNTVRWNQLAQVTFDTTTINGVTFTNNGDGTVTVNGTATAQALINTSLRTNAIQDHKLLIKGCPQGGSAASYRFKNGYGVGVDIGNGLIETSSNDYVVAQIIVASGYTANNLIFTPQIYDLTQMFGAGNEPATVAEFEALFPDDYYPYDAGSLLSVNIEGIKTTGQNLLPFDMSMWTTGLLTDTEALKFKSGSGRYTFAVPIEDGASYTYTCNEIGAGLVALYTNEMPAVGVGYTAAATLTNKSVYTFNNTGHHKYLVFQIATSASSLVEKNQCRLVRGSSPKPYRPYVEHVREIPVATYFPQGLRSAGTAHDALYADHADTVIGAVDLGTLTWTHEGDGLFRTTLNSVKYYTLNLLCVGYTPYAGTLANMPDMSIFASNSQASLLLRMKNTAYTDAATFKAAMDGVILYYELANPTTTAIDPPLNLSYHVEQGGTESIVVPTGEQSAPPTMAIVYGYTADGLRDEALAVIAPVENGKASTNYAIGGYLVHNGILYKVTVAIASGESITPGTNITATTVMEEIVSLTS